MSSPVTRSMKKLMLEEAQKQSSSAANLAQESAEVFPFLSLPGEIRNIIYRQYFSLLEQTRKRVTRYHLIHVFDAQPALTRVNKQTRAESLPMYYAETRFRLDIHIRDYYTADDMWNITNIAYPPDQIHKSISVDNLYRAAEVFAPAQGQNAHNLSHWRHVRHINAQIEINFVFFHAHLEGNLMALNPPKVLPNWRMDRCDLANIAHVGALIDDLMEPWNELLILFEWEFADEDRDRLIDILLLYGRLFPAAAKYTNLHLHLSAEQRESV